MSHLAVPPSTHSLPCLAPRPHFPRNGFKVQHATRKSSQSMCGCVLRTVKPTKRKCSRSRRLHSIRSQAAQNSSSGSPALDTGQTGTDTSEQTSVDSSTDIGDADLDAIIAAGGNFDDQSATGASDMYQQLDDEESNFPQEELQAQVEEEEEEEDPDASYPDRPVRSYTLAGLLELADISMPEDFEEEEWEVVITGLQNRSHKVREGDLYIHVTKPDEDIWGCVHEALQRGAAAVIASEAFEAEEDMEVPVMLLPDCLDAQQRLAIAFFDNPSTKMTVVGVTGSSGKTTTSWLIRGMFDELDKSAGLIGTVEYGIDEFLMDEEGDLWKRDEPDPTLRRESSVPFCLTPYCGKYEVPKTLPDGLHVQKIMAGQADRGAAACVLECTASGLHEGRCDYVDFDVAVFTNILKDKVEAYGGITQYLDAQGSLFMKLLDKHRQRAVINTDDPYADDFKRFAAEVPVVTYAINDRSADVFAEKVSLGIWETDMIVKTPIGHLNIITPLIGRNNVYNVLAAVATGLSINIPLKAVDTASSRAQALDLLGLPILMHSALSVATSDKCSTLNAQTIVAGIEATEVVPGRTEYIDLQQNFQVLVDSANTPQALSRLLEDVKMSGARKILLVFGCEGNEDAGKRPFMGEIAHYKADTVIISNQNQRSEDPNQIVQDIIAGFPEDILEYNAKKPWPGGILQDVQRPEYTLREFVMEGQNRFRRYVCEDRYTAIRWAIAAAQKGDVVVIAGKGDKDWTEVSDGEDGYIRGWLDDRVECRNALSKLYKLDSMRYMDRSEIPFMKMGERESRYWEWGKK